MAQREIPCLFIRGGTSRGPYFLPKDLPEDVETRDRVLLAVMGSPDPRQIDGLGGATTPTSKVAIVGSSDIPDCDVDYLFAQVSVEKGVVDTAPSCGNMLAGVGPFAIERGLVEPTGEETAVSIYNVNTQSRIEAVVQTPNGQVSYEGDQRIDGVSGTAAPIVLSFSNVVGSKCDSLLPTGECLEEIEGIEVTCCDVAMPMLLIRAGDLGLSGYEREEIAADKDLMTRIETIRREAGKRMGLGDVTNSVIPKVGLLAPAREGGAISSRYLTPHAVHAAHAVTGAICISSCISIEGTVANALASSSIGSDNRVRIEHPSGSIEIRMQTSGTGSALDVTSAGVVRTARKIMDGRVCVPSSVWPL
ncbi:MAG: 4-oxalomesaconate tautomerase [Gammaproteobacteria bacterium]